MGEIAAQIIGNRIIQTGAVAWVTSQVIKTILHLIVNKKIVWERLVGDGGMPSSHSATVTSSVICERTFVIRRRSFASSDRA